MNQPPLSNQTDAANTFSLCIGLGQEAERLLTALRTLMQNEESMGGLVVQSGTDPSVVDAWSAETPPYHSSIETFPSDVRRVSVDRLICPLAAHGGEIFDRME